MKAKKVAPVKQGSSAGGVAENLRRLRLECARAQGFGRKPIVWPERRKY